MSKKIGTKITLAVIVFGIACFDSSYNPFDSVHSLFTAVLVLGVIFFGDQVASWLKRK